MGNVCSFDSPDLVRYVAVAAAAGLVSVIPTFAVAPDNADILSVQGSFTVSCQSTPRTNLAPCANDCIAAGPLGARTGDVCTFPSTSAITPYISGPSGRLNCNVLSGATAYSTLSCPSVTLTALPTGQYVLAFDDTLDIATPGQNSIAPNTFTIGLPQSTPTTTLDPVPATTTTATVFTATSTATITGSPVS